MTEDNRRKYFGWRGGVKAYHTYTHLLKDGGLKALPLARPEGSPGTGAGRQDHPQLGLISAKLDIHRAMSSGLCGFHMDRVLLWLRTRVRDQDLRTYPNLRVVDNAVETAMMDRGILYDVVEAE